MKKSGRNYGKLQIAGSAVLSGLLVLSMPMTALAENYDIGNGSITVEARDDGNQYVTQENVVENEFQNVPTVISGESNENTVTINAAEGQTAEVTFDDLNIDVSGHNDSAAVTASGDGNVTIDLDGESSVKSGMGCAGIQDELAGELTITSDDEGKLQATGGFRGAGIGGTTLVKGTDITISGDANVTATGGNNAAGIGGGNMAKGERITITDKASVIATGGREGAGIGGGHGCTGADITINGQASVEAEGGDYAAGIGGGLYGDGGDIIITDQADVTAIGGDAGAGIGGGQRGVGEKITISGEAQVGANGGNFAAGIGTGELRKGDDKSGAYISISGQAVVSAVGGPSGAGIGGGYLGNGKDITISEQADVSAHGGFGGAGIGGGRNGAGQDISINGDANVKAAGTRGGAGIGGGLTGEGSNISVSENADVSVSGGDYNSGRVGAGIGDGTTYTGSGEEKADVSGLYISNSVKYYAADTEPSAMSNATPLSEQSGGLNPSGSTVSVAQGEELSGNSGTVESNRGNIGTNNDGGVIKKNYSSVGENKKDGEIGNNYADGTIDTNNGSVKNNRGNITTNNGTVGINQGYATIDTNNGVVTDNYATIKNNNGRVINNFSKIESGNPAEHQWWYVTYYVSTVDNYSKVAGEYDTENSDFNSATYLEEAEGKKGIIKLIPIDGYRIVKGNTEPQLPAKCKIELTPDGNGYVITVTSIKENVMFSFEDLGLVVEQIPEPEPNPDSNPEPEPEPNPNPNPEPTPDPKPEPKPEPNPGQAEAPVQASGDSYEPQYSENYAAEGSIPVNAITIIPITSLRNSIANGVGMSGPSVLGVKRVPDRAINIKISALTDAQYKNAVVENINVTPAGGMLRLETDEIACFDRAMLAAFVKRGNVDMEVIFPLGKQKISVLIPAGFDVEKLLDSKGYCGFLRLLAILKGEEFAE